MSSSSPQQPSNNATSETGPSFKDEVENTGDSGAAPSPSNQTSSDDVRNTEPPRPAANEPPPTPMVPLKEAALVNPSAVNSEVGDVAHQRHLLDLERERLQIDRERLELQQQQSRGTGMTKQQWVMVGLVVLIVAASVAITAFVTSNSSSPCSNTDPAPGSGVVTTLRPVMPTTTNVPIATSPAPVVSPITAPTDSPTLHQWQPQHGKQWLLPIVLWQSGITSIPSRWRLVRCRIPAKRRPKNEHCSGSLRKICRPMCRTLWRNGSDLLWRPCGLPMVRLI